MEIKKIQDYLNKVLTCDVSLISEEIKGLPFFVRKIFSFHSIKLFSKNVFLAVSIEDFFDSHAIRELESTSSILEQKVSQPVIFVFETLSRQERLMLIKRHFSFIVPGTQMFIPYLGIDLFERIQDKRRPVSQKLRPAAQAILIEQLLYNSLNGLTSTQVGDSMNYTSMGVHRAFNQLKELKLCKIKFDGYRKTVFFEPNNQTLWEKAQEHLVSPVKKVVPIEKDIVFSGGGWPYAGEYALSLYSDLSCSRKCYAVHEKTFRKLVKENKLIQADSKGGGVADIQVWRYFLPQHGHGEETVDMLSLGLSFHDSSDPRIKIALLELKEHIPW